MLAPFVRCDLKIFFLLKDLDECESYLLELNLLLKSMEVMHRTYSAPAISALQVSMHRGRETIPQLLCLDPLSLHCITRKSSKLGLLMMCEILPS